MTFLPPDATAPAVKTLGYSAADTMRCSSRGCMAQARLALFNAHRVRVAAFCDGHRRTAYKRLKKFQELKTRGEA